jgi:hypothetical protein
MPLLASVTGQNVTGGAGREGYMRALIWLFTAGLVLTAATSVPAKENYKEQNFNADTKEKFDLVSTNVREAMKPGGRYEYVKPAERSTIEQKLSQMDALFKQSPNVAEMSQQTKIDLFNDQEVVNSILTQRDSERVICTKAAPIGSHIPITTCHTYGQEQDAHNNSEKVKDTWTRTQCGDLSKGACGGGPNSH